MRSDGLAAALAGLADEDLVSVPDRDLATDLRMLFESANRLSVEIGRRVTAFDQHGLAKEDSCRSTAAWLRGYGRLSGPAATTCVRRAHLLDSLPAVAMATAAGAVSAEHLDRLVTLAQWVGPAVVARADADLADVASQHDPVFLGRVCGRIVAHVDPDGSQPDAAADFARRGLTLTPFDGMVIVRGQLDPEGGAALATALDAVMPPPASGDPRTPAQRRADALVEVARGALRDGRLPRVGGV
jgi:hypothetical protein